MISQLARFAGVGAVGFVVDVLVLYGLLWASLGYLVGRLGSFLCAVWVTWRLNRRYTFRARSRQSRFREWLDYLFASLGGGAVNLGTYTLVMDAFPHHFVLPLIAVGLGSLAGLIVNFTLARFWVYGRTRR